MFPVCDNLNTHTTHTTHTKAFLYQAFEAAEAHRLANRLEIHHTPKHGSWLNIGEIELSALGRQCLGTPTRIPDRGTLLRETKAWEQERNRKQVGVDWQFTTKDARIKLKHLYPWI